MSRDGHQGLAICLALGTGLRGKRQGLGATRLRFIHLGLVFRSCFFQFFVRLLRRESVRAREAFGHVFFSSAASELKARSLHRDDCWLQERVGTTGVSCLAPAIVLLFVVQLDMAIGERTATEIARMLTVI